MGLKPRCGSCGSGRQTSTARTGFGSDSGRVPRVGSMTVRYKVGGKSFATLTAAQDYAAKNGGVIQQL